MSENNRSDVKLNDTQNGTVSFATEVIATIAGLAATEVDGVASMSSPSSGFAEMFARKKDRNFTKGVRIDLNGSEVTVDITIVVDYGSPVPDVARNIQENVKKAIETMAGLNVHSVDIHVCDISFEREQRANAELDEQQRKMLEKAEEPRPAEVPASEPEPAPAPEPVPEPEPEPGPVPEPVQEEEKEAEQEILEVQMVEPEPEEEAFAVEKAPDSEAPEANTEE